MIKSSEGDNDHTRGLYFITIVLSLFILFTIVPFVISIANDPEVLIKSGELMAKLNLIENDVHACLSNCEFSDSNAIWTGEQVWLIDLGRLRWTLDTASTISQVLIKRMRCMSRINLFLEGYVKYNPNNYERIISHCKSIDWTWVNKKTIMNEQLKCHV